MSLWEEFGWNVLIGASPLWLAAVDYILGRIIGRVNHDR